MTQMMKALCCTCGSLRECRRPRNYRHENYWLAGTIDRDWRRETGELKCVECGRITVHAIIRPDGDRFRDHAEMLQSIALGWSHPHFTEEKKREIRQRYHGAFPRNPYMDHLWWKSDENAAREAGIAVFPAMCGVMIPVPEKPREGKSVTEFRAPEQLTDPEVLEHERFDVETGLWWDIGDCVNCLHYRNAKLLRERREKLAKVLLRAAVRTEDLDAEVVNALLDKLSGMADK